MGYTTTTYKYDQSLPGTRPAYRGVVREYTDSPVVIVHQCELVHYDRNKAIKDAEKLIKIMSELVQVATNTFQSEEDLEANLGHDEARDEKNIDEDLSPDESNVY